MLESLRSPRPGLGDATEDDDEQQSYDIPLSVDPREGPCDSEDDVSVADSDITSVSRSHLRSQVATKHSPFTSMFLGRQASRNEDLLKQKAKVLLFYQMLSRKAESEIQPSKDLSFVDEWLQKSNREQEAGRNQCEDTVAGKYDGEASASLKSSAVTEGCEETCSLSKYCNRDASVEPSEVSCADSQKLFLGDKDQNRRNKSPEAYCIFKDQEQGNIAWTTSLMLKEIDEDCAEVVENPYVYVTQGWDSETNSISFSMNIEGLQRDYTPAPLSAKEQGRSIGGVAPVQRFYIQNFPANADDASACGRCDDSESDADRPATGESVKTCSEGEESESKSGAQESKEEGADARPLKLASSSKIWKKLRRLAARDWKATDKQKKTSTFSPSWIPRCLNKTMISTELNDEFDDSSPLWTDSSCPMDLKRDSQASLEDASSSSSTCKLSCQPIAHEEVGDVIGSQEPTGSRARQSFSPGAESCDSFCSHRRPWCGCGCVMKPINVDSWPFTSKVGGRRPGCSVEAEIIVTRFIHRDPSLYLGQRLTSQDDVKESFKPSPSRNIHISHFA